MLKLREKLEELIQRWRERAMLDRATEHPDQVIGNCADELQVVLNETTEMNCSSG